MIQAKPFHLFIEAEKNAPLTAASMRMRSWHWEILPNTQPPARHFVKIEKEVDENSRLISEALTQKTIFPTLRIEIRIPYHHVDLIFKAVQFISLKIQDEPDDEVQFEDITFKFKSVEYVYKKMENESAVGFSKAEMTTEVNS